MSDNVRIQRSAFSVDLRDVTFWYRWARNYDVDSLRKGDSKELEIYSVDIHRESGVSIHECLRWEEVWELESHVCDAVTYRRVRVRVCVHPDVGADRISNYVEGLQPGGQVPSEFIDWEGGAEKAVGADVSQVWDMVGR